MIRRDGSLWSARDPEKAKLLIERGADVNAPSYPPQSGWLDELGSLQGGRAVALETPRDARLISRFKIVRYHPQHPAR
jgi:hypothetical protein